jgi:hypothetical protein
MRVPMSMGNVVGGVPDGAGNTSDGMIVDEIGHSVVVDQPIAGGGVGAKFQRCFVSEIIAVDVPVEDGRTVQPPVAFFLIRGNAGAASLKP